MTAFKTDASEFISEVERVQAPAPGFVHEYERAQIMTSRSLTIRTRPLRSVSLARAFNCELLRGGRSLRINIIVLKETRVTVLAPGRSTYSAR